MTIGKVRASVLFAAVLAFVAIASPASAVLESKTQMKCSASIGKAGLGYVKSKLKLLQKCRNAALKDGSTCTPDAEAITKLETKLATTIEKACSIPIGNYVSMGFPGPCSDATPATFTLAELTECIRSSHEAIVDQMMAFQYDATLPAMLAADDLKCQAEVAKQSGALTTCMLKNVQKCRDAINKGKTLGVAINFCSIDHEKTVAAIDKCETKLTDSLADKCTTTQIAGLKICEPDQANAAAAATCLIDAHEIRTDDIDIAVPPDLIDFEYAVRGGLCGDNVVNNLNEECDGTDDAACPGLCGPALVPDGHFACLCKNKPRIMVMEHGATSDTDNGWTGQSSDGTVVDGGSYVIDLYDCDGGGLCNAGPRCSLPPHAPCAVAENAPSGTTSNSICAGLGQGVCRKERTAVGPHCFIDHQKKCNAQLPSDPVCNDAPGDFCQVTFHGAPVAAAAGGVAVCNYSVFSEDIVGTVNINDGTTNVKMRQRARTHQDLLGAQNKPCPVCGGFCDVSRERCDITHPCAEGTGPCITAPVCSNGPNIDKPCRNTPPFGGPITLFGTTSVDCPPNPATMITSSGGLDINVNPRTTGTVTLLPNFSCVGAGFTGNTCRGGTSEGRPCTVASQCPGGVCSPQCFCLNQVRPNACDAACVGGANDAEFCVVDSECPGGFCHPADCRQDFSDTTSNQEGICTSGPNNGFCSITSFRSCSVDADCDAPNCLFCEPSETCIFRNRACFVNSGITRQGDPRDPTGVSAGVYCVPANSGAIDPSAGFPGPSGLYSPETVVVVP